MAHILVVEDDAAVRGTVAAVLALDGHTVTPAEHGLAALELLRQHRPDVIVLDLLMPKMDGWTFVRECRLDPSDQGIPIVVMSAYWAADTVQVLLGDLGVCHVLAKPFHVDALRSAVHACLAATERHSPAPLTARDPRRP